MVLASDHIQFSSLDQDLLGIDESAGYCYSLNVSAARIWELMKAPVSVSAICSELSKEFAIDEETCSREVFSFLQSMHEAGLIRVSD